MAITVATATKNTLLSAILRTAALNSADQIGGMYLYATDATTLLKYKVSMNGASWAAPSGGAIALTTPVALTHVANGTIAKASMRSVGDGQSVVTGLLAGLTGGQDIVVNNAVITGGAASSVTDLRIFMPAANGTVQINTLLRNRLLAILVRQDTAHSAAAGTIKVYTGTAPATADDAATGTELLSFTTSTTSWNTPSAGSAALAATLSATAGNSGTAGYARFSWTANSEVYVIQFSIGTAGTDGILNSITISAATSYNLTACTLGL